LKVLWAVLTEFRTVGPFELNWETQQYKCWISQMITFSLLASLQAVNIIWLFLILRILKNYIFNSVKRDERSDNEEDEEDNETQAKDANGLVTIPSSDSQSSMTTWKVVKGDQLPQVFINGKPANGTISGVNDKKER
jgi:very-long-chain ceramide synthase